MSAFLKINNLVKTYQNIFLMPQNHAIVNYYDPCLTFSEAERRKYFIIFIYEFNIWKSKKDWYFK